MAATCVAAGCLIGLLLFASLDLRLGMVAVAATALLVAVLWSGTEPTGTVLVTLALFMAPMNSLRPSAAVPVATFADVFLAVGFLLLAPGFVRHHARMSPAFVLGTWLLLAASLVPLATSGTPLQDLTFLARLVVAAVAIPAAFAFWRPPFATIRTLAWAYVAGTSCSFLLGLVIGTGEGGREQGLTTHPNFLSLTAQLALALLIFLFTATPRPWRWVVLPFASLSVMAVVTSGSRAGLIVIAFTAAVVPILSRSAKAAYFTLAGGVGAMLVTSRLLTSADEGSALYRLAVGTSSTTGSDLQRRQALDAGWRDFLSNPLIGSGFNDETLHTHNVLLQVGQAAGLVGLLGFVLVLWAGIASVFRPGPLAALGYTTLGYALVGLLQPSLWDRLAWIALALSYVATTRYEADVPPEQNDPVSPRTRGATPPHPPAAQGTNEMGPP